MTYLATTLYINKLYQDSNPKIAIAGEGLFNDVVSGLTDEYNKFKKDFAGSPITTVLSFLGPGMLTALGMPWFGAAYAIADALGFNWVGFWNSMKTAVSEIFSSSSKETNKPTKEELHEKLAAKTEEAFDQNIKDTIDEDKLNAAEQKYGTKTAHLKNDNTIIKEAGVGSLVGKAALKSRGLLRSIFSRIIPWAITSLLVAIGYGAAGGAASGLLGIKRDKDPEEATGDKPTSSVREPIYSLGQPENVPDLFEFNKNDMVSVWIEDGNINNIKEDIKSWILQAFPKLQPDIENISNSPSFIEVENMFKNRNKLGYKLKVYSIPKPFERKIDIVSYIVNKYLKNKGN